MKKRFKVILAAFAFVLAACALAAGIGKVEYATADLAKRTAAVAWTWTDLADNAVRLSLTRNGEDFPTAGWGGTLFIGDGALGCAVAGTPNGYNELFFDVGRDNVPTNGKYAVQIIATNVAGRVEEWARGTLTVRANPAAEGMPTNWSAYADIARRVAANVDVLWGAVSNSTDALIRELAAPSAMNTNEVYDIVAGALTNTTPSAWQTFTNGVPCRFGVEWLYGVGVWEFQLMDINPYWGVSEPNGESAIDFNAAELSLYGDFLDPPITFTAKRMSPLRAVLYQKDADGNKTAVTVGGRRQDGSAISTDDPDWASPISDTSHTGRDSLSAGRENTASGAGAVAFGTNTTATGASAMAQGYGTTATGAGSHAEGSGGRASGAYSHSEGFQSYALGVGSHASGHRAVTGDSSGNGHSYSFAWQGTNSAAYYFSHGNGTFNINPTGGANGFYVGNENLNGVIANAVTNEVSSGDGLWMAYTNNVLVASGLYFDYSQHEHCFWPVGFEGPDGTRFDVDISVIPADEDATEIVGYYFIGFDYYVTVDFKRTLPSPVNRLGLAKQSELPQNSPVDEILLRGADGKVYHLRIGAGGSIDIYTEVSQ